MKGGALLDMHVLRKPRIMDVAFSKNRELLLDEVSLGEYTESPHNLENAVEHLKKVNAYAKQSGATMINLAFTRQSVALHEYYPNYMLKTHQYDKQVRERALELIADSDMTFFDFYEDFKGNPEHYYYKTDHHPNFNAMMHAYDKVLEVLKEENIPFTDIRDIARYNVSELDFIGSLNRRMFRLFEANEHLPYYELKTHIPYQRKDYNSPTSRQILNLDDPYYNMYMGGDIGYTEIDTSRPELPNVLVIGDSTTNALETILWPSANKMVSISFYSYSDENVLQVIDRFKPDIIIFSFLDRTYSNNYCRLNYLIP